MPLLHGGLPVRRAEIRVGQSHPRSSQVHYVRSPRGRRQAYRLRRGLSDWRYQVWSRIPDFVPIFGVLLGGVYWITHRREDVAQAEAQEGHANEKGGAQ